MSQLEIRESTIEDSSLILRYVKELARNEKAEHEVLATEADIKVSLFDNEASF